MSDRLESLADAVQTLLGSPADRITRLARGHSVWSAEAGGRPVVVKGGPAAVLDNEAWGYRRAGAAGVPVPEVLGRARDDAGRGWLVLSMIPGVSLSKLRNLADEHGDLVREAGVALRRLHDISGSGYGDPEVRAGGDGPFTTLRDAIARRFDAHVQRLRSLDVIDDALETQVRRAVERDAAVLDLATKPALVHGDFAPRHIFVDTDARRIVGVLDLGAVTLGDPAYDFAVFSMLAVRAMPELIDGYGADSPALVSLDRRVRLYRLLRRVEELAWGHLAGVDIEPHMRRLRKAARRDARPL